MFTLLINFIGTATAAAAVSAAYLDLHPFEYKPEVYKVSMSDPVPRSIQHEVVMFNNGETLKLTKKDMTCLTDNIFYEAGVEDFAGKIAVAQVTLNRLKAKRWGNTICKVVYAPHQFSWTKQKNQRAKRKGPLWEESKRAAAHFVDGVRLLYLHQSLYYHASWMKKKPRWAHHKIKVHEIGQHIFYKPKKI